MLRRTLVMLAASAALLAPSAARAEDGKEADDLCKDPPEGLKVETVKIGTLAPAQSPWGKVFTTWHNAVCAKTNKALDIRFYWNGQQGDEGSMVDKMKTGQLDGAAITAVGLSKIYKPILVLQMPGLFRDWPTLDKARDALKGEFEGGLTAAGFTLAGWGDVGLAHTMSYGLKDKDGQTSGVVSPEDFKGQKPYMWSDDSVMPVVFSTIGGVSPVPLSVPMVLPNLSNGNVNIVTVPSLVAQQLQWASKLDAINSNVSGAAIGALVLTNQRLGSLSPEFKAILVETGAKAGAALTKRIRDADDAAYEKLKASKKVVTPSAEQIETWRKLFIDVRKRLGQGVFPKELVDRVEKLAGQ